ncbi:hypothetical protein B7P43_G18042 [Cryptotermes secundus]|uniref:DUF4371 domain-containing protein n=1 Tax=Cryptotermes secundus TaxID=105785 RepID=A0A2J7R697_9NEOP|nr:hypothetical protein B7P43_G18042 [Cryptotermes secundus]
MVFGYFTVKKEFVKLLPLLERTRGENIFNVFLKFVKECNLPLSKLVAITTDGAPSITVTRVVNYIRSSSTCHRLFRNLLNVSDTEHGDIIFHADIRWLKLNEISWLLDLALLTDITSKLNELNLELKGKDRNVSSISVVNAFQKKLKLWIPLFGNRLSQFSTLEPVTMFISNPFATADVSERKTNFLSYEYQLCHAIITRTSSIKDLGVFLDSKLHFHTHVNYIFSERIKLLGLIRSITYRVSSLESLFVLYFTLGSKLEYASVVRNSITSTDANKLEHIQQKFASVCFYRFFPHISYNYTDALEKLSLHSLHKWRHHLDALFLVLVFRGLKSCASL